MTNRQSNNKKRICLALQGGGAYGALTWGILDRLLEDKRLEIDAVSATSAGSVNAIIVVDGMIKGGAQGARLALNDFWYTLSQYGAYFSPVRQTLPETLSHHDIVAQATFTYFDAISRIFSPYTLNPFNFNILRLILSERIDFEKVRNNNIIKLFLCATNVETGKLKIFENNEISVEAVLASSCLPHLSQAVEINDEFYWDGGFLGNPAIFPLIYNSQVDDIVIISNNPIVRNNVPMSSQEIANRTNEISFNSSLIRELRAISFITSILDAGWIKDEYKEKIRRKYTHLIRSDETMNQFTLLNKYKWQLEFLSHLRDLGQMLADEWLENNFDHIGKKSTIDFSEFGLLPKDIF